jgi:hypothetical protein
MITFEQQIYLAVTSRGVFVRTRRGDIPISKNEYVQCEFIDDKSFSDYCHWLMMYARGYCEKDILIKILSGDGLSRFYDERDLSIPYRDTTALPIQAKQAKQEKQETIDKKENAIDAIKKYEDAIKKKVILKQCLRYAG